MQNSIINANDTWISTFIGRCECFCDGTNIDATETIVPLEAEVDEWWCNALIEEALIDEVNEIDIYKLFLFRQQRWK